jgi:HEAT repeat protein
MALTYERDQRAVLAGINITAQFGFPRLFQRRTMNRYFQILNNTDDWYIISSILVSISHNNELLTHERVQFLSRYRKSRSVEIRSGLQHALSCCDHDLAIDIKIQLSADKIDHIRDWATFALASQTELDTQDIRAALWARTTDPYLKARDEALMGLAIRKDPGVKPLLVQALTSNEDHGSLILEAIEVFNDADFIPLLEQQIDAPEPLWPKDWIQNSLVNLKANVQ